MANPAREKANSQFEISSSKSANQTVANAASQLEIDRASQPKSQPPARRDRLFPYRSSAPSHMPPALISLRYSSCIFCCVQNPSIQLFRQNAKIWHQLKDGHMKNQTKQSAKPLNR